MGYQLLQKTSVSGAIQRKQEQRTQRTEITADYVLEKIKAVVETAADTYNAKGV